MQKMATDVVIIGGGTAGMGAFRAARRHTEQVLLIEDHQFGTTCARVGCMPSKLLIAAAEAHQALWRSHDFGIDVDTSSIKVDGRAVMARVKSERDRFVGFVVEDVEAFPAACKLLGRARFVDAHTLLVDDKIQVSFQRAVIATGSRPVILPAWQALGDRLVINDDIFAWDDLPESVAVFGPGVIGLELGQALSMLGVRVAIFGVSDHIGGITDPVIADSAREIFAKSLDLHLNVHAEVSRDGDAVWVHYQQGDKKYAERFDYLLAAIGRRPNVDQLGLDTLALQVDSRGVPEANRHTMQTSLPHIFIAGDASNQLPLLHEASDQGVIAGSNAGAYPNIERGLRRSAIGVIFSHPQIMSVGERYAALQARYVNCDESFVCGEVSFHNQGRSRVMLVNQGRLRLYADACSARFLGAEMIGPAAEHMAHLLAWAHQQQLTVHQMLEMPFYHPVIEEGVRTALRDVAARCLAFKEEGRCRDCVGQ